ncbi:MAG: glucosamine-6-phosphate deaminase [Defluviitaleaceae bacterium]|nr:glucosamine-6-phosphate deaminase [Defluviitaleaceae bacterium]
MLRNFTLYVEKDYQTMSQKAAEIFAAAVNLAPTGAYGFATGSTPIGMYEALIKMHKCNKVNLSAITAFNLDEYYPISASDPQSYQYYMRKNLFDAVNLPPANTHIPSGEAKNPLAECIAYDEKIAAAGGINTQILGIGNNGHIGFNEPDKGLMATTCYIPLAEATIDANARFFASAKDIPRHALTMGMHSIMMARQIILLASGEGKADILNKALRGPITTNVPASLLQLHHDVIIVADQPAASLLN